MLAEAVWKVRVALRRSNCPVKLEAGRGPALKRYREHLQQRLIKRTLSDHNWQLLYSACCRNAAR